MENEKRLIDAERLKRILQNMVRHLKAFRMHRTARLFESFIKYVNWQPTVDAVEVVHGRWEQVQRWATKAKYRCSVCGREIMSATKVNIEKYPYCHCGAKMDGGED